MQPKPIGSRWKDPYGYVWIKVSMRGRRWSDNWKQEHRMVLERMLGRALLPFPLETAHHKNEIKDDNRPRNLELKSLADHTREHHTGTRHTAATRAKMSAAHRGRKFSATHRANIAAARRGTTASPETRAKMSASHRARWAALKQER